MKNYELEVVRTALNTQHKADDTALKARQTDMLPKILELIDRESKKIPTTIAGALIEHAAKRTSADDQV